MDEIPEALYGLSRDGIVLEWNRGAERMFGYSADEAIGREIFGLVIPPDARSQGRRTLERVVRAGGDVFRTSRARKDGTIVPVEAAMSCVRGTDRNVRFIAVRDHDLSDVLRLEDRAARVSLRGLLDAAPDAMAVARSDGVIADVNKRFERLFRFEREELLGMRLQTLVSTRSDTAHGTPEQDYFADERTRAVGAILELRGHRKDGAEFPVEVSLSQTETSEGLLMMAAVRDTSRRKLAEDRFRVVLEAAPDATVIVNTDEKIVLCNSQTERIFGYSRGELMDHDIHTLFPERFRDHYERSRTTFFADSRVRTVQAGLELIGLRKDGSEFPVEIILNPIETEDQTLAAAAVRDITARKAVETQLRASLSEKEVLLKEIHHRVKNNLQIVSSMLNLQMMQIKDPATRKLFTESQDRVRSISLLHEQLYHSSDLARVDIAGYLQTLASGLFRTYGVDTSRIALALEVDDVPLGVDSAIPCGLIINELVSNALKHAFPSGASGTVRVSLHREGDNVALSVADDGIGFPEDFDFQHPASLGLKLVSILTDQIHGTIELHRKPGTRFVIRFTQGAHT